MRSVEFILTLKQLIHKLQLAPIIENSYFILGAGKFGKQALKYVMNQPNSPYILIIDKEINTLHTEFQDLTNIINIHEVLSSDTQRKYYLQTDIGIVSEILQCGFPESFIPAVPIHALAYIIEKLYSSLQPETILNSSIQKSKWTKIIRSLPKPVLLKEDSENGVILLSWAKMDELCPPNCDAPLDYCPHHHRDKPCTITEISRNIIIPETYNYTIESHQTRPGLGIIYGTELKLLIIDCLSQIQQNLERNQNSNFIISTTCNCHGVINVFSL